MSPRVERDDVWVSDDESIAEKEHSSHKENSPSLQANTSPQKVPSWRERLKGSTHVDARGNNRPPVGQVCLVMIGKNPGDQGQVGVVTRQSPCMVEVSILPKSGLPPVSYT
jgi:hypothetical protein